MVTYNEVMLNRSNLRALHGARLSLSSWAQPSFLRLRGSHFLEPQLSRTAQTASPRIYSPWVPSVLPRKPLQTLQSLPRYRYPLNSRRAFSSGPQSSYQRNTYNRFGTAGRRQPLLFALVQYLKPHHYVMIGLGLSGVYLYNTDVVEASQQNATL
jgi:hypothetical protein